MLYKIMTLRKKHLYDGLGKGLLVPNDGTGITRYKQKLAHKRRAVKSDDEKQYRADLLEKYLTEMGYTGFAFVAQLLGIPESALHQYARKKLSELYQCYEKMKSAAEQQTPELPNENGLLGWEQDLLDTVESGLEQGMGTQEACRATSLANLMGPSGKPLASPGTIQNYFSRIRRKMAAAKSDLDM